MGINVPKIYYLTAILLGVILSVNAYSKYGRTCQDIGCLPNEVCALSFETCSYTQREGKDCGSYPTCKKKTDGSPQIPADKTSSHTSHHNAPEPDPPGILPSPPHHGGSNPSSNPIYPALPNAPSYPTNPSPNMPNSGYGGYNNVNSGGYVPPYAGGGGYNPGGGNSYPYGGGGGGSSGGGSGGIKPAYGGSGDKGGSSSGGSSSLSGLLSILGGSGGSSGSSLSSLFSSFGQGGSSGSYGGSGSSGLSGILSSFGGQSPSSSSSGLSSILSSFGGGGSSGGTSAGSSSSSGLGGILSSLGMDGNRGSPTSSSPSSSGSSSLLSSLSGFLSGGNAGNLGGLFNTRHLIENKKYGGLFNENPSSSSSNTDAANAVAKGYPTQASYNNQSPRQEELSDAKKAPNYGWNV